MSHRLIAINILVCIGLMIVFMSWYQWTATKLSESEVNDYMQVIETLTQTSSARHDLPALRKFLKEDDGKPFYTVNLYRFNQTADYPKNSEFQGTGAQAYERFSQTMVPLMLKRGSHPVFASVWSDLSSSNWDQMVIVRYRSRRDLVDLFATQEFAKASLHKWASIQSHERLLVEAIHIPDGFIVITLLIFMTSMVIVLIKGLKSLFK